MNVRASNCAVKDMVAAIHQIEQGYCRTFALLALVDVFAVLA
jgi:hypothetical protein